MGDRTHNLGVSEPCSNQLSHLARASLFPIFSILNQQIYNSPVLALDFSTSCHNLLTRASHLVAIIPYPLVTFLDAVVQPSQNQLEATGKVV